ncbi:unnamed protein product [Cuscuta epithymum]|uniref:Retrotransposon Copia-like N-terminal domain-containing protein n=1 Tax=Cuscuta epithymum TaxID=186058 RepID=A0AAV0EUF5_9ASTE|nr:unnamed protein product [Cuscuta epithymum]
MVITESTSVISITASTHFPIKLTPTNFPVWKCQVHAALIGLGLEEYVDGGITAPDRFLDVAKTQINPCYTIWYRQDKTILSALIGSCSDPIQPIISTSSTAHQAWDKLSTTYASTSRGRIISLKTMLSRTTKGSRSVTDYLAEMQAIADALALAQNPVSDEDLVVSILNGLGSQFPDITSAIRIRETPLPLAQLQTILLEQETRNLEQAASTQDMLPTVHATQSTSRPNFNVDRRTNSGSNHRGGPSRRGRGSFTQSSFRGSNPVICRFCENSGHDVRQCRKLQRFLRDNHVPHPSSPSINHTTTSPASGQPWLFDSGASHHVTSDVSTLPSYILR